MSLRCVFGAYVVDRCGYYRKKKQVPEFLPLDETLHDIRDWIAHQDELRTAKVFEKDGLGLYFHKVIVHGSDIFVSLWNEVPASRRGAMAIAGNAPPGDSSIATLRSDEGDIVGFPSYYWFIPSHNPRPLLIVIGLPTAPQRIGSIRLAIRYFLKQFSRCAVYVENDAADLAIAGYSENGSPPPARGVLPSFRTARLSKEISERHLDVIRANLERIGKVVARTHQTRILSEDVPLWRTIIRLGIRSAAMEMRRKTRASIELSIPVNGLDPAEFEDIRKQFVGEEEWEDVGFSFRGESVIHWLSKADNRVAVSFQMGGSDSDVVELEDIMDRIVPRRAQILARIEQ